MKKIDVRRIVFVADDGKEFLNREECEKYEKFLNEVIRRIKYFVVHHTPDLTETGRLLRHSFVAVFSPKYGCEDAIVWEWAERKYGPIVGPSVQGYGYQEHFRVESSTLVEYLAAPDTFEKVFLSQEAVEGFPTNVNFAQSWGFK